MSDPSDLLGPGGQPRRFGDYVIHGLLGQGGMARIYAAEEVLSRRPVALKVLRSEFASSEQGRRQFIREMGILANIDDPHIVRCLSCVEIENQPVMVLEQLDGWTLRQVLEQRGALPWAEAARVALQIARALHTAHTQRPPIIHRDLKPENVMYLRDGRIKVMDFGIAKLLQAMQGATSQPIGTLQYMSPEHVDARPVDPRSDLFALGVVLYEMLAGRPPFASASPRELLEQICTRPAAQLPGQVRATLPVQLEPLLRRLLAKSPDERPSSATEVIVALEALVGGAGLAARAQAPQPQAPQPQAPAAGLDTLAIVESARKHPLQVQVEAQFDEVAQAVSRFGRATSALIVRVLVGLMIFPAAAVLASIPGLLLPLVNRSLVGEPKDISGFWEFEAPADLDLALFVLAATVFVRACWVHHREPREWRWLLWLWLGLGALIAVIWAVVLGVEMGTVSDVDIESYYGPLYAASNWVWISVLWVLGRITSRVLRWLERARSAR